MKLLFLGDFYYAYGEMKADILALSDWIQKNEYQVILNLEGGLTGSSIWVKKRGRRMHQSPMAIDVLKQLNVIGVCLANNHMMDFGDEGLGETLRILNENGIAHVGAGMNLDEALTPMRVGSGDDSIILQNFGWDVEETLYATDHSPGCAPREEELVLRRTEALRRENPKAKVITVFHWGFELNPLPQPYDVQLAHQVLDLGGDLIIGHHPHNIQPFETYLGKRVYYSLGNFYFSDKRSKFGEYEFQGPVSNLCDYGAMVVYDSESGKTEHENLLIYDREADASRRVLDQDRVLRDYSEEDFFSSGYVKKAIEASLNSTPILTRDRKGNRQKLQKLFFAYRISAIIRRIRKNPLGEKLYLVLKKMVQKQIKK